jgi:hypothetical protein
VVPAVLYGVEIGTVAWPVDHLGALLRQEYLSAAGGMTESAVLQEVRTLIDIHKAQQILLQHFLVALAVHTQWYFWAKIKPARPYTARKASPNHHTVGGISPF